MSHASLPLRTRLFGAILKTVTDEPASGTEMVELRGRRQRLLASRVGTRLTGDDDPRAEVTETEVELGGHTARLRIHRPAGVTGDLPVVLHFHGGGWCIGSPEQSRWLCSRVAAEVGAVVIAPTYRLAPEHPYPAAVEDAIATLDWIVDHAADFGGDATRVAVMGDSAGGNLAAVCAINARDAGSPALRAQVLIYPGVEAHEKYPSEVKHAEAPLLSSTLMRRFVGLYLSDHPDTEDWQASPIRADSLADLPPALILTAGHDPLSDHGTRYALALRDAGSRATLLDYPDTIHGFVSLPGVAPPARRALRDIVVYLSATL